MFLSVVPQSKGQRLAVEAVAVARKAGVDIELTLVGAGNQKPLRKLARRLGVEDLVNIHGPTDDVGRYWSAAHVGLMCSECEAFGLVTVEAMRAGLPVCGTNAGGTPEIIDPGVNGLLSPAGDANALAANLMALESDEDLRRRLAFRAVETAQRFQRDHVTAMNSPPFLVCVDASPIFATARLPDQPTRRKRAKSSTRSAAAATLSAGLVIRVAISRARVTYCGARILRRSATSDFSVVVEKRRAVPTFNRLTGAPTNG